MANFNDMITVLRRWLSGEARASDERALDAALRDDPFAAEAMEGYRKFADADHAARLERLRHRLHENKNTKRRGGLYFLPRAAAVAASVLLLAGAGWWLLQEDPSPAISNSETTVQTPATEEGSTNQAIAQTEEETAAPIADAEVVPPTSVYSYNSRSRKLKVSPVTPSDAGFSKKQLADVSKTDDVALSYEVIPVPDMTTREQELPAIVNAPAESKSGAAFKPAPESAMPITPGKRAEEDAKKERATSDKMAKAKSYNNNLSNLAGRVTNDSGDPLPGVAVIVEGTQRGASTDMDGNFNLPLSGDEQRVVFNYTGYESLTAAINNRGLMNVILKENAATLSEVQISSPNAASRKKLQIGGAAAKAKDVAPATAAPQVGTDAYETYLKQNLRLPEAARRQNISGVVKLRFTVDKNGKLSNFKTMQSLGYGCDEEAIRLIKEGPVWQISGDARKVQVEWEIRF